MPNAFEIGRGIERRSRAILEPMLEEATDGRFVYTDKGRLAIEFQRQYGDVLIQEKKEGKMWSIEFKAEEHPTGNLFLEVWSNGKRLKRGWMDTLRADLLFYHFLESDELYIIKLPRLQRWFHFGDGHNGKIHMAGYKRYPMKLQKKHNQMNDTWGCIVPIAAIKSEVGMRKVNPLGLFGYDQHQALVAARG